MSDESDVRVEDSVFMRIDESTRRTAYVALSYQVCLLLTVTSGVCLEPHETKCRNWRPEFLIFPR